MEWHLNVHNAVKFQMEGLRVYGQKVYLDRKNDAYCILHFVSIFL